MLTVCSLSVNSPNNHLLYRMKNLPLSRSGIVECNFGNVGNQYGLPEISDEDWQKSQLHWITMHWTECNAPHKWVRTVSKHFTLIIDFLYSRSFCSFYTGLDKKNICICWFSRKKTSVYTVLLSVYASYLIFSCTWCRCLTTIQWGFFGEGFFMGCAISQYRVTIESLFMIL